MNFNKCNRCGCFFSSNGNVCPSCAQKDNKEISTLNGFFSENQNTFSVSELSSITGISMKNISRHTTGEEFGYKTQILSDNTEDIFQK